MAANYYATYKRFNGADWDIFYFTTVASQVAETTTRKWLTDTQQSWLNNYLDPATFNAVNKLVQLDASGLIPFSSVPSDLGYLYLTGGTMSGDINMNANDITNIATLYGRPTADMILGLGSTPYLTLKYHATAPYALMSYYLDMNNKKIVNLADPVAGTDAATRQFVEQLVSQGTHVVDAVVAASTTNITTLSGVGSIIDGVTLELNDRVLLKNQTTVSQNGIYLVNSGAWTKLAEASDTGSLAFVLEGTLNSGKQFYCNANNTWVLFFVQDTYFATVTGGLEVDASGFGFGIKASGVTNAMLAGSISNDKLLAIAQTKISAFGAVDTDSVAAAVTSYGVEEHLSNLYSMIKSIKGTANAHTSQSDTIASLKTLTDTKNRTYIGTTNPLNTGYINGDVYLQYAV